MAIHLKAARVDSNLTRREVVEALREMGFKITENTLANYELYKTIPDIATAQALATVYKRGVDDIIFFTN